MGEWLTRRRFSVLDLLAMALGWFIGVIITRMF